MASISLRLFYRCHLVSTAKATQPSAPANLPRFYSFVSKFLGPFLICMSLRYIQAYIYSRKADRQVATPFTKIFATPETQELYIIAGWYLYRYSHITYRHIDDIHIHISRYTHKYIYTCMGRDPEGPLMGRSLISSLFCTFQATRL